MRILPGIPCGLRLPGKEDTELSKRKNGSVIGRFFGRLLLTLVLVGVLCAIMALGMLAKAMGEGLFVEHALMSASHHLQLAALGSVADVFAF